MRCLDFDTITWRTCRLSHRRASEKAVDIADNSDTTALVWFSDGSGMGHGFFLNMAIRRRDKDRYGRTISDLLIDEISDSIANEPRLVGPLRRLMGENSLSSGFDKIRHGEDVDGGRISLVLAVVV